MRILFLPNFPVYRIEEDDPNILSPNKIINGQPYWFFKHLEDITIDVLDNTSPFPFKIISKYTRIEFFQAIKALFKTGDYDVIISHSYNSGFFLSLIRSLLLIKSPPHIIIDIGCLNGGVEKKYQIFLLKLALRSVNGIIYHSTVNEEFYKKHFSHIKRVFIPFGTDPEFFCPFKSLSKNNFALSIGYSKRDYTTLINAWKKISYPLKIIGYTNISTSSSKNIQLLPKIPITKLKEYIHDSTFIILPIENEQYSVGQMTLTQCMAMGKSIIVNNVPGIKDYLGNNCLIVEYKNETEIIEKVNCLLNNRSLIQDLSHKARLSIVEKYNEKKMAEYIYKFICEII